MLCKYCGRPNEENAPVCRHCGNALRTTQNQTKQKLKKKKGVGLIIFFYCLLTILGFSAFNNTQLVEWLIMAICALLGIVFSFIYRAALKKGEYKSPVSTAIIILSASIIIDSIGFIISDSFRGLGTAIIPTVLSIYTISKVRQNRKE